MLYGTAYVAERYSGIRAFLEQKPAAAAANGGDGAARSGGGGGSDTEGAAGAVRRDPRLLPVTAAILSGAPRFAAADVYDANARLAVLRAAAVSELSKVDLLLVPTALAHYTIKVSATTDCIGADR
jgi:allophanate hydrolase